jgi:hypothetical protein
MKFSSLLENINKENKNAFILGMIYGWPLISKNQKKIYAYCSYKKGKRIIKHFNNLDMDYFYDLHRKKISEYFGIDLNNIISNESYKEEIDGKLRIGPGISIVVEFDLDTQNIDSEIFVLSQIEKALIDANKEAKNYFILGLMDSRGSLDFTGKYIAIDITQQDKPNISKRKINKYYDLIGATFNYNPRLLQEKSNRKNDQFRIDLKYFMGHYGLFTPFKIEYYKKEISNFQEKISDYGIFLDNQYSTIEINSNVFKSNNLEINDFAIKINSSEISEEEKKRMIDEYRIEHDLLETDDEIVYSSVNIKSQAKLDADFICEFNHEHKTFIAKADNNNYVEAHHLIPFSKRKEFDLNIDVLENIVCLCPNCHRRIHLAIKDDREKMLKKLYEKRLNKLQEVGIDIKVEDLIKFYI